LLTRFLRVARKRTRHVAAARVGHDGISAMAFRLAWRHMAQATAYSRWWRTHLLILVLHRRRFIRVPRLNQVRHAYKLLLISVAPAISWETAFFVHIAGRDVGSPSYLHVQMLPSTHFSVRLLLSTQIATSRDEDINPMENYTHHLEQPRCSSRYSV
jgi:hypothetical protein